jgi:hypothetical protein
MRVFWRAMVILVVFAGVGWLAARAVMAHAVAGGAPLAEMRLSSAMAGLFSGGAAAVVVGIALLWKR